MYHIEGLIYLLVSRRAVSSLPLTNAYYVTLHPSDAEFPYVVLSISRMLSLQAGGRTQAP